METIKTGLLQLTAILIDICFKDETQSNKTKFKKFKLELVGKEYASRLGCYNTKTKVIQLSGLDVYCRCDVIITFLHEVSHHIEFIKYSQTGHQKTFYDIHIKLLKTAVDLGLLKTEDITDNKTSKAGNRKKLGKMMMGYKANGNSTLSDFMNTDFLNLLPEVVENRQIIKVKCQPEDRYVLKDSSYRWNSSELIWEKSVKNLEEYNKEIKFLIKQGYQNIKIDKQTYYARFIKVCAFGNTYLNKETIASLGYKYKDGIWSKPVKINFVESEVAKLRKLNGVKIKYEF